MAAGFVNVIFLNTAYQQVGYYADDLEAAKATYESHLATGSPLFLELKHPKTHGPALVRLGAVASILFDTVKRKRPRKA